MDTEGEIMTDSQPSLRQSAEREAELDLKKPPTQLLADVHEELLRTDRSIPENLAHANKRMASLTARSALSSDRSSKYVIVLTWVIVALTVAILFFTFLMWKQTYKLSGQQVPEISTARPLETAAPGRPLRQWGHGGHPIILLSSKK